MPSQFDMSHPNMLMLGAAFLLKELARKYPLDDDDQAKVIAIAKGLHDVANSTVWKAAASGSVSAAPPVPRDPGVELTPLARARRRPRPTRTR